ncbi:hypothetical protein [Hymenobacter persicinus]|uniref:Uncharacterized protein n=1 Tax=Hymenobacter persicinus TaxID=2025506 RepID=A0A4Q5LKA0_9BACT|nr:hypothetical protein [Hymenobacter persicinus]RYU84750.1 hypothetical protein EWM57_00025 [Hymenobacter persicinus]
MPREPHDVAAVLHQVHAGLSNPQHHFMVCTTYFETENGPVMLGTLHLHQSTMWNLQIGTDGFVCEVLLQPGSQQPRSSVRVAYANIWQVLRGDGPNFNAGKREGVLYENNHVLSTFAKQGLTE